MAADKLLYAKDLDIKEKSITNVPNQEIQQKIDELKIKIL